MTSDERGQLGADLSAYLDGELSEQRAAEIEQVLAESAEARGMLGDLRAISDQLGALPKTRAPEDISALGYLPTPHTDASERESRTRRARVYQLVARISATAALIALCVFAGQSFFGHEVRPTEYDDAPDSLVGKSVEMGERFAVGAAPEPSVPAAPGGPLEGIAAKPASAGAPAVAMGQPRSLGYVGAKSGPKGSADAEAERAAPVAGLAGASQADSGEQGVSTLAAAMTLPPDVADQPEINVVVAPRNADEYNGTLQTVAQWRASDGQTLNEGADLSRTGVWPMSKSARSGGRLGPVEAMMAQEITLHVPPDQVNSVLIALNEQAPRQVQATMSFNTSDMTVVQQMVTPAAEQRVAGGTNSEAEDAAEAEETPQPNAGIRLGRGTTAAAGEAPGYAGGGKVRRGVATRTPARGRVGGAGESKRMDVSENDVRLEKSSAVARDKRPYAKLEPGSESRTTTEEPRNGVVQLGARLRETYEQVFAAVFRGEGDARLADAPLKLGQSLGEQPVRLRVKLLSPTDSQAATQPANATETP